MLLLKRNLSDKDDRVLWIFQLSKGNWADDSSLTVEFLLVIGPSAYYLDWLTQIPKSQSIN